MDFEAKYGFAKQLAGLTDEQLVARFNAEVGNCGWGTARSYFLSSLHTEMMHRSFDSTAVVSESGLKLGNKVELQGGVVVVMPSVK